jgi:hypothetical protein
MPRYPDAEKNASSLTPVVSVGNPSLGLPKFPRSKRKVPGGIERVRGPCNIRPPSSSQYPVEYRNRFIMVALIHSMRELVQLPGRILFIPHLPTPPSQNSNRSKPSYPLPPPASSPHTPYTNYPPPSPLPYSTHYIPSPHTRPHTSLCKFGTPGSHTPDRRYKILDPGCGSALCGRRYKVSDRGERRAERRMGWRMW